MKEQELTCGGWAPKTYLQHIFIRYRMSDRDYRRHWDAQDGKCAGCKGSLAHPWEKNLVLGLRPEVDHEHKEPGRKGCEAADVRGLLCRRCNDFLGKIQDNMDILQSLVDYLKQHRSKQ